MFQLSITQSLLRICAQLQIQNVRVSCLSKNSWSVSLISGDLNVFTAQIQDAPGSSHHEKPPGTTSIFAVFNLVAKSILDCLCSSSVHVSLYTCSTTSKPAAISALFVSSSELVPGNTGIRATGFSLKILTVLCLTECLYSGIDSTFHSPFSVCHTFSRVLSRIASVSSIETSWSHITMFWCSAVFQIIYSS